MKQRINKVLGKNRFRLLAVFLAVVMSATLIGSIAFFTDRETGHVQFTTVSFSKDGYTLTTKHPNGPFIANEDVVVTITEESKNAQDTQSTITMTVSWASPDPNCFIFGNSDDADNATIQVGDTLIAKEDIIVSSDKKSITFDLPVQTLTYAGGAVSRDLIFHIPESLMGTGTLSFTYDKVALQTTTGGFSAEYSNAELNASDPKHDFTVKVGWAASAISTDNGKSIMGYLKNTDTAGEYEIYFEFPFADCTESAMKDFTSKTDAKWSHYKDSTTKLTFVEGMTTIGDYAFPDFEQITSLTLPESVTAVGTWAFDNISITTLTLPEKTVTYESMSFGHINELTEITFNAAAGVDLSFPTAGASTGAFYVDPYVPTRIYGANDEAQNYDWVTDQRRVNPVLRAYEYTWEDGAVDTYTDGYVAEQADFHADEYRNTVKTAVFADQDVYYADDHYAVISTMKSTDVDTYTSGDVVYWNVTDPETVEANPNAAYSVIAALDTTSGALTIMADGPKVMANVNSNYLFCLFEGLESIDARKYDTRNVVNMGAWHAFNDPPRPAEGVPDDMPQDDVPIDMKGAKQVLGTETWDMSNVGAIWDLFYNAKSLETLDVSTWDTSSMVYTNGAFQGCGKLTELDVSNWEMGNVVRIDNMFARCEGLTSLPVENWDVSKVKYMDLAFSHVNVETLDLSKWQTDSLTSLYMTFRFAGIKNLNVSGWNVSGLTDLFQTFSGTTNLESLDLTSWNQDGSTTANITTMYQAFCESGVKTVDMTGWDFTACTDVTNMFDGATRLTDITGEDQWNTATWECMGFAFRNCESLTSLDVANWNTSGITGQYYAFKHAFDGCRSLKTLAVDNWDVSNSETFEGMFKDCSSLESINISNWDMSGMSYVYYARDMFNGCANLTELTFPVSVNYAVTGMAANCPRLTTITYLTDEAAGSIAAAGYKDQYNYGAFYIDPAVAAAENVTLPVSTAFNAPNSAALAALKTAYAFSLDNRKLEGIPTKMLLPNNDWYRGSVSQSTVTTITLGDNLSSAPATYDESWDASLGQDGSIIAYLVGTDLHLIGDGTILANPDSSYVFGYSGTLYSFYNTTAFNYLDVLDTSTAETMKGMFYNMRLVSELNLSNFDTSNTTAMDYMFYCCSALEALDLSSFDTSKVTRTYQMFYECDSLESLDVSSFDTSNVTTYYRMFYGCNALKSLDLTNFNTTSMTTGSQMFNGCSSLESVILGAGIHKFSYFQLRNLSALTTITFLHGKDDTVTLPTAGGSSSAFYVSSSVDTTVITDNTDIKEYDWAADNRVVTFSSYAEAASAASVLNIIFDAETGSLGAASDTK